jgi:predicted nucleic acid-binding protein
METAAPLIVSGDKHLLDLENFQNIHVVTSSLAVEIILRLFKHN